MLENRIQKARKMKIIFLDIDGVLLNISSRGIEPCAYCVKNLNDIVKITGAKIVVSSTWRKGGLEQIRFVLAQWGVTGEVIGITPVLSRVTERSGFTRGACRGDEIARWLEQNGPVDSFVILDDDGDMGELRSRLVTTSFYTGLTRLHAAQAIGILEG